MENKGNGNFYDRAKMCCTEYGYDTVTYCGEKNGYSYYYLSNSKSTGGYKGTPCIIRFTNGNGHVVEVMDHDELMMAYYMSRKDLI